MRGKDIFPPAFIKIIQMESTHFFYILDLQRGRSGIITTDMHGWSHVFIN